MQPGNKVSTYFKFVKVLQSYCYVWYLSIALRLLKLCSHFRSFPHVTFSIFCLLINNLFINFSVMILSLFIYVKPVLYLFFFVS